jgi:transcriptional regulator with XRE-family HTH domain
VQDEILTKQERRPDKIDEVAFRLRRLREALGFETTREFAAYLGIHEQTWYHVERGRRVPTVHDAIRVADRTGASLDWIYRGLEYSLPVHLAEKLRQVDA